MFLYFRSEARKQIAFLSDTALDEYSGSEICLSSGPATSYLLALKSSNAKFRTC